MTKAQQALITKYDAPPYVSTTGSILSWTSATST